MKQFVNYMCLGLLSVASASAQEWKSGVEWQEPPVVTPGASNNLPPSDAIVLFDGSDLSAWEGGDRWLVEGGVAIPQQGEIRTKQTFGDIQLHVEWAAPTEIRGAGQGRGNSGVFLMGLFEVQVLDSFENETYFDGQAASIYKQTPPMANAMRQPGEWNAYDIFFTTPSFRTNGDLQKPAFVTVVHNGVLVLNHFEIMGPTSYVNAPHYDPVPETGPISLQFHGDPVKYRNIWVRELKPAVGRRVSAPFNIQPPAQPKEEPAHQSEGDDEAETPKADDAEANDQEEADKTDAADSTDVGDESGDAADDDKANASA